MYSDDRIKPLHIMLRITSAYVKSNVQTKWMYFLIEDDDLILSRIKSVLI